MERRYQVFVSSTFVDLQAERSAVASALLQMDAFPAGMELFPAADEDAWTLIESVLQSSDYYLLVIGGRYGSIETTTALSYTEKEYNLAVSLRKPVMAFLHADPDAIPVGKSEKDAIAREKLDAFRRKVSTAKHVKFWHGPDDLAARVATTFAMFRSKYPAVGWVRGDVPAREEAVAEINALRKQLEATEKQLREARTAPPPEAFNLAQGEDPVDLAARAHLLVEPELGPPVEYQLNLRIDASWDELFAAVGPALLDETEETGLKRRVDGWLRSRLGSRAKRSVRHAAADAGTTIKKFTAITIFLREQDFETVVVQLRALGLIDRSQRKRSVSDKGRYWTLTPYGDSHLITLRARNKQPSAGKASDMLEATMTDEPIVPPAAGR